MKEQFLNKKAELEKEIQQRTQHLQQGENKQRQREQLQDKRIRNHVVAVVTFHDGRTGIKVLPRQPHRILYYYNNVLSNADISSVQLYQTTDIFFNRYPNSSALKVHFLERAEIQQHLQDATPSTHHL